MYQTLTTAATLEMVKLWGDWQRISRKAHGSLTSKESSLCSELTNEREKKTGGAHLTNRSNTFLEGRVAKAERLSRPSVLLLELLVPRGASRSRV